MIQFPAFHSKAEDRVSVLSLLVCMGISETENGRWNLGEGNMWE